MKRLKLCLIALIICFGLYGCKGIDFTSTRRYADCMNLNWHLSLPETDVVIYEKNSLLTMDYTGAVVAVTDHFFKNPELYEGE